MLFANYGSVTVVFARFVSVLRQLNGVVAGTMEMDWRRFLIFNALGGALWVVVWTLVGFYVGSHGAHLLVLMHRVGFLGAITVAIILMAILAYVYGRETFASLRRSIVHKIKGA